jgi:hypothetical protein
VLVKVEAPNAWCVEVTPGPDEWAVQFRCPGCPGRKQSVTLQSPPWHRPDDDRAAALLGPNAHYGDPDEFAAFERQRAAGLIEHRAIDQIQTELWCHACERGASITLTEES